MRFVFLALWIGAVSVASAQQFANRGFQAPVLAEGTGQAAPTGSEWAGSGDWGIGGGASEYGPGGFASTQFAWLGAGATLSQTLSGLDPAKTYRITFYLARRKGSEESSVSLKSDEQEIFGPAKPTSDGAWQKFGSKPFRPAGSSAAFSFSAAGGKVVLLDGVKLEVFEGPILSEQLLNRQFEFPEILPGTWTELPQTIETHWVGDGLWGVVNGSGGTGKKASPGKQYGYLKSGTLAQTVYGLFTGGAYRLRFRYAAAGVGTGIQVEVDGIGAITPAIAVNSDSWQEAQSAYFLAQKDPDPSAKVSATTIRVRLTKQGTALLDGFSLEAGLPEERGFRDGGFESVTVADNSFSEAPAGTAWRGQKWGIGSGVTLWSGAAAAGSRYAVVQKEGWIEQDYPNMILGATYRISFKAARATGRTGAPIVVLVEDKAFEPALPPADGSYREFAFTFRALKPQARIRFAAQGGEAEAATLLDSLRIERLRE